MDIKELMAVAKTLPFDRFEQKLESLVREDYHFRNLNETNRKTILNIIKSHLDNIRNGIGISSTVIERENYKFYENRIKLGLTEYDLKSIKEVLNLFKK